MNDICIPIPRFKENQVDVKVNGKKEEFYFRVESFPWSKESTEEKSSLESIEQLRKNIDEYDRNWELVQIYTPSAGSQFIQVLFRKKIQS